MNAKKIRNDFIKFFQDRDHRFIRSSPVVPIDDQTLLFTNAGMNQFKPIFLGEHKADYQRAVNTQKCCLLYTSPSPRDATLSRMPSSA